MNITTVISPPIIGGPIFLSSPNKFPEDCSCFYRKYFLSYTILDQQQKGAEA